MNDVTNVGAQQASSFTYNGVSGLMQETGNLSK